MGNLSHIPIHNYILDLRPSYREYIRTQLSYNIISSIEQGKLVSYTDIMELDDHYYLYRRFSLQLGLRV